MVEQTYKYGTDDIHDHFSKVFMNILKTGKG